MAKRKTVKVNANCVADRYADEKIIEFITADGKLGGLVAFTYNADAATLTVAPYRLDAGVRITCGHSHRIGQEARDYIRAEVAEALTRDDMSAEDIADMAADMALDEIAKQCTS